MEKLTGHGRPSNRFVGVVGQHYEDLDTGDLYECRIASEYSRVLGAPVGGYVWERRAKGEDIREIYGSGSGGVSSWNDLTDKPFGEEVKEIVFVDTNEIDGGTWDQYSDYFKTSVPALAGIKPTTGDVLHVAFSIDGVDYERDCTIERNSEISLSVNHEWNSYFFYIKIFETSAEIMSGSGLEVPFDSLKITKVESNIKTIDPKFIPAGVGGIEYITIKGVQTENGGYEYSCNKTKEECIALLHEGVPCVAITNYVGADIEPSSKVCTEISYDSFIGGSEQVVFLHTLRGQSPETGVCFDIDGKLSDYYYSGE